MATGYEAQMYRDITKAATALSGIEKHLGAIADALAARPDPASDDLLAVARATGVLAGEYAVVVDGMSTTEEAQGWADTIGTETGAEAKVIPIKKEPPF